MSSNQPSGIYGAPSDVPRGGPRGGWRGRGRGAPPGGPNLGQPPPPYQELVVPVPVPAPTTQNANAQHLQQVTHIHVTIAGNEGAARGGRGGQRGATQRGRGGAERGRGRGGAEAAGQIGKGGARGAIGYSTKSPGPHPRGAGGATKGAPSNQSRGGHFAASQPASAPPPPPPPQEFNNPIIPFSATISGGFTSPTRRITVIGTPSAIPQQFSVNLKSSSDFMFHFNPRFSNSTVVRNSTRGGRWQTEETTQASFPFVPSQTFSLIITSIGPVYNVSVNGQHFTAFAAHGGQNLVNLLTIEGDVTLQKVTIE